MPNSPLAVGARTRLSIVRETTFNQTPNNPAFQELRPTDFLLANQPRFTQSKEIRADGMSADQILIDQDVSAKYNTEMSLDSHDDILEAALRTTKTATPEIVNTVAQITSVVVTTGVYNVQAGLGTPFLVGHLVKASGFANAANNATSRATATGANAVTMAGIVTVAEAAAPIGARLKVVGISAAAVGSISASLAGAVKTISVATTNPATLGISAGSWFKASGFTGTVANNGWYRCVSITGAGPWIVTCDIVPTGFATDAAAGQIVNLFFSDSFRPGNTRISYAAEEAHLDMATFKYGNGLVVDTLTAQIRAGALIPLQAAFVGASGGWAAQVAGATYAARKTTTPLNTSKNIGKAYINGAWISGVITSADITFKPNPQKQDAVGTFGAADITFGDFDIDGSLEKFMVDTTLNALMMAGTPTNLVFELTDPSTGSGYLIDLRQVVLMEGQPAIQNATDPIKEPYKFTCNVDKTVGYMAHVQKIEAYA